VEALHEALRVGLADRMTAAGWFPDPAADTGSGDGVVGSFRRPVNDDFAVTAWFAWLGDYPPLQVDTVVGVSYEKTYPVWPMLFEQTHSELKLGVDGLGHRPHPVELWDLDEVSRAVDQLVAPVLDSAIEWAEPFVSLDTFLAGLAASNDEMVELSDIPVVLAAAGRVEDARQAFADALVAHRAEASETYWKEFAARFTAWLASGAVVPDRPSEPPVSEPYVAKPVQPGDLWAEARQKVDARRAAISSVSEREGGRSTDELRVMLRDELNSRGLTQSPREIETMLDGIQANSFAAKAELRTEAVGTLLSIGRGIFSAVRNRNEPTTTPSIVVLPDSAGYPVATSTREWHSVTLDVDAQPFLEQVNGSARKGIDGSMRIQVWLSDDPDGVAVHIGRQRVGRFDLEAAQQYLPHMASASPLGLAAVIPARLTRRNRAPKYLLELEAPLRE
jgi:hypothetical protein